MGSEEGGGKVEGGEKRRTVEKTIDEDISAIVNTTFTEAAILTI